jgi:hypothetical protein
MEIIGAGFGRTGTVSLQAALHHLGVAPCYHMGEVFQNPESAGYWVAAARGDSGALRQVLQGYRAALDWPSVSFWRELAEEYPHAKVILTTRDPAQWYESMEQTIFRAMQTGEMPPALVQRFGGDEQVARRLADVSVTLAREVMVPRSFDGSVDDRDHVISCYERHNEEVRRTVAADRLLDFDVTQGWGPLCEFLGVPVPAVPFPHDNGRATLLSGDQRSFLATSAR